MTLTDTGVDAERAALATAAEGPEAARRPSLLVSLTRSARPRQWVKNGFVIVPAAFGGVNAPGALARVGLAVVAFCVAASSLYLVNDVCDRDADRLHARKQLRPIASGALGATPALVAAIAGLTVALLLALMASPLTALTLAAYAAITLTYSLRLKNIVILDVMLIASGFVLRVIAGSTAAAIQPSEWLLLCTMFLSLFLGFGKRRHELMLLSETASGHRRVLDEYTKESLDQFLGASMVGTLLAYALYTFFSPAGLAHRGLMVTIPFAAYGIFRYMLLAESSATTGPGGGSPEELLLTDRPLQIASLAWILVGALVLYGPHLG